MIEIQCPRCLQYWYDNDEDGGRVRLCSNCLDHLRQKRGYRPEMDIPFLVSVGMFLVFDLMLIALSALMPAVFGTFTLGVGVLMLLAGWATLMISIESPAWWLILFSFVFVAPLFGSIEWRLGRWAMLMGLSGYALIGAYSSFAKLAS